MLIIIIACKVISGKCIHIIYHSTRLAPQCHAFHLVIIMQLTVRRVMMVCLQIMHVYKQLEWFYLDVDQLSLEIKVVTRYC